MRKQPTFKHVHTPQPCDRARPLRYPESTAAHLDRWVREDERNRTNRLASWPGTLAVLGQVLLGVDVVDLLREDGMYVARMAFVAERGRRRQVRLQHASLHGLLDLMRQRAPEPREDVSDTGDVPSRSRRRR